MHADYPLRFDPVLRCALWGGRRLETVLGKSLPPGNDLAESWEIVDHGCHQSRVTHGPLRGWTLGSLVRERGRDLLGRHHPLDHFPLLFKFLDVRENLSVQVHPNDEQAARLDPPDHGKSEAWFVLSAEPGSRIFMGLREGIDRQTLETAVARGETERCLHSFEPATGDCVWVPAGTVHALGAGLLIAEIQQSSDTTFRLFDWNRVGADGLPRLLHIGPAMAAIDFQAGPGRPVTPTQTAQPHIQRLVDCDKFVVDHWVLTRPAPVGGDDGCHVVVPVSGRVRLERDAAQAVLKTGQTALVPAAAGKVEVEPEGRAELLDIYLGA